MKTTNVFTTALAVGTEHLENDGIVNKDGWNMVNSFKDQNIIKCAVGVLIVCFWGKMVNYGLMVIVKGSIRIGIK